MDITALLTALPTNTDKGFANTVSSEDGAPFSLALAAAARESEGVSAELLSEILPAPARETFTALTLNTATPSAALETDAETIAQAVASDEILDSAIVAALPVPSNATPNTNSAATAPATDTVNASPTTLQSTAVTPMASALQTGLHPATNAAIQEASTSTLSPTAQADTAATMAVTDAGPRITKAAPATVTSASADTAQERPLSPVLLAADNAVSGLTSGADLGNAAQPAAAPVTAVNTPVAAQPGITSTTPTLQSPLASDAWGRELEQQLVGLAQRGDNSVELQLNPRELGPLSVNLTLDDQGAKVQFLAAQASVRTAVEQAIPQLRDALAQQGIALGEATVGEQQQQQQQSSERDYGEDRLGGRKPAPEVASSPADVVLPTGRSGGVDLYA